MSMNVNIHHAQVQPGTFGVYRNSAGELVVSLNSTQQYGGSVIMFLSDQEWNAIVERVNAFRESEQQVHESDVLDIEREQYATIAVCEECGDTEVLGNLKRGLCYPCDRREAD
jgi:hypothetical protein